MADRTESSNRAERELQTARMLIRPYTAGDRDAFIRLNRDPLTRRHLDGPLDDAAALERFDRILAQCAAAQPQARAILRRDSGEYAGHLFVALDSDSSDAELGIILRPEMWRQGLATEILSQWIPFYFSRFQAPGIAASVDDDHIACIKLLERLGFTRLPDRHDERGSYRYYVISPWGAGTAEP